MLTVTVKILKIKITRLADLLKEVNAIEGKFQNSFCYLISDRYYG